MNDALFPSRQTCALTFVRVCVCARGESQQWFHLGLLWWNRGGPPANTLTHSRGGLQRGLLVCLQCEKGKHCSSAWVQMPNTFSFYDHYGGCSLLTENPGFSPLTRWRASGAEAAAAGGVYRCVQRGSREGQRRSRRQHAACSCGRSESSSPG